MAVLRYCHKTGVPFADGIKEVAYTAPADNGDPSKGQAGSGWLGKLWNKKKKD